MSSTVSTKLRPLEEKAFMDAFWFLQRAAVWRPAFLAVPIVVVALLFSDEGGVLRVLAAISVVVGVANPIYFHIWAKRTFAKMRKAAGDRENTLQFDDEGVRSSGTDGSMMSVPWQSVHGWRESKGKLYLFFAPKQVVRVMADDFDSADDWSVAQSLIKENCTQLGVKKRLSGQT